VEKRLRAALRVLNERATDIECDVMRGYREKVPQATRSALHDEGAVVARHMDALRHAVGAVRVYELVNLDPEAEQALVAAQSPRHPRPCPAKPPAPPPKPVTAQKPIRSAPPAPTPQIIHVTLEPAVRRTKPELTGSVVSSTKALPRRPREVPELQEPLFGRPLMLLAARPAEEDA